MAHVKSMVEALAAEDEYDEFVRFMFSVGLYEDELQFNYIHPTILQAAIMPSLRPRVLRKGKNHFELG